MNKKYKRIGWVVEWRNEGHPDGQWATMDPIDRYASWHKPNSIGRFNTWCHFDFIPKRVIEKYGWLKRRGLARCVPVYVEVQDD